MNTLDKVLAEIRKVNESREDGTTMSGDDTNEDLINIFRVLEVGAADEEESLCKLFGEDGYYAIREAEQGYYN